MLALSAALEDLGYAVVERNKFWQFSKKLPGEKVVTVDLLTGPVDHIFEQVKVDDRRVRPKAVSGTHKVPLHGRLTPEALGIEIQPRELTIVGNLSSGKPYSALVRLPSAFAYLLMKLTAFDDRKDDAERELGAHHALDVFRIVAMMDESQFETTHRLWRDFASYAAVMRCRKIVEDHFVNGGLGTVRIQEHSLGRPLSGEILDRVFRALAELASPL